LRVIEELAGDWRRLDQRIDGLSAKSAIDNFVHQLGTPEGRKILGAVGAAVGFDPTIARMVTANIPLPGIDQRATDNRGVLAAPSGMTICRAGTVGALAAAAAEED
jgi:hypothetical protein